MRSFEQRLSRVAKVFGCPRHEERLTCPVCEPPDPLPESLNTSAGDFIQEILARVGQPALREICLRVLPPHHGACARCGTPRECQDCKIQYTKDVFRAIQLTDDEQATLETILQECRRLDHERGAHDQL